MEIYLNNTLSGKKEKFKPNKKGHLSIYSCGPTVYKPAQIGNLMSYIFADTIKRVFEFNDFKVKQVINITDVGHLTDDEDQGEDKVEKSAREENKTAKQITEEITDLFINDLKMLNIDVDEIKFPKATEYIKEQIEMVKKLEEDGFTYKISDGIYFDTSKLYKYGHLGGLNEKEEDAEHRVEENKEKKNLRDFALWKFSKPEDNRQQEWESPWGLGFPGWHLECSVMSEKLLGKNFDIHTGGIDHIPTHHNNEIAQSESANGTIHANFWLHHNHITIEGKKISKSLNNDVYLNELKDKNVSPAGYRYWTLIAHYKTQTNFTWKSVSATQSALNKLVSKLSSIDTPGSINEEYLNNFTKKINDDLNMPEAIALIWDLIKEKDINDQDKLATILKFDDVLGFDLKKLIRQYKDRTKNIPKDILVLVNQREEARENEDWNKADKLRDKIEKSGYTLKDTQNGPEILAE